jgi:hypothetical protein
MNDELGRIWMEAVMTYMPVPVTSTFVQIVNNPITCHVQDEQNHISEIKSPYHTGVRMNFHHHWLLYSPSLSRFVWVSFIMTHIQFNNDFIIL